MDTDKDFDNQLSSAPISMGHAMLLTNVIGPVSVGSRERACGRIGTCCSTYRSCPADLQMMLAAHERETHAPFAQDILDPRQQRAFEVAFLGVLGDCQEIELVRVLEYLLREVGFWCWQGAPEIRHRLPLAVIKPGRDLMGEHRAAPAVPERRLCIPEAGGRLLELGQHLDVLLPRQSSGQASAKARM